MPFEKLHAEGFFLNVKTKAKISVYFRIKKGVHPTLTIASCLSTVNALIINAFDSLDSDFEYIVKIYVF